MALVVHGTPRLTEILRRSYSHVEGSDRARNRARGISNLKRIFARPDELRILVQALGATIGDVDALAAADAGSAPLAAVVGYELGLPSMFVDEAQPLAAGSRVHVVDDLVYSGATLAAAARTLRAAGFTVGAASSLLIAAPTTGWPDALEAAGVRDIAALATTTQL